MKFIFLNILLCLFAASLATAQISRVTFEHLSVDEGLSQSTGVTILQDNLGFMWFGTQDGLNKYDGLQFVTYRRDPADTSSISSSFIISAHQDRLGWIWLAVEDGLEKFDPITERFYHYTNRIKSSIGVEGLRVWRFCEDHEGVLWLATSAGLVRYNREADSFELFEISPGEWEKSQVVRVLEDSQRTMWVVAAKGKLYHFDRENTMFRPVNITDENGRTADVSYIMTIFEDRSGTVWLGTGTNGLLRHNKSGGRFFAYRHDPDDSSSLSGNGITALAEDKLGNLWVGLEVGGLDYLDLRTGRAQHFVHDPYDPGSLSNNFIYTLYSDDTSALWVGTGGGGINKYHPGKIKFQHVKNDLRNPDALRGSFVWSLFEDHAGRLWVGTQNGGLNVFYPDGSYKVYTNDPENPTSLGSNTVLGIGEDQSGAIWVGTGGGGLNKLDLRTGQFKRFPGNLRNPDAMMSRAVKSIHTDKNGILWLGTMGGGLHRLDPRTEEITYYRHDPDDSTSISSNVTISFLEDSKGYLWIGTNKAGLNRFDKRTEEFTRFQHDPEQKSSLSDNHIMSIAEDRDGNIWTGTFSGLNRLDPVTGLFRNYTTKDGLANDVIYCVLPDDRGFLWLSSNHGLSRFDPKTGAVRNFDLDDGLQSYEFNADAGFKSKTGMMYFGGVNGYNFFHPDSIYYNPNLPPVVIKKVKCFDQPVDISRAGLEAIPFSYRDDFITFEFAALDYTNPQKNTYAYKLEGLHEDWIQAGHQRFATFTNLSPGEYVFRVKAANNDGLWNHEGASLKFVVRPPFWQTWWFRWLSVMLGLIAVGLVIHHFRETEKRKAALDRKFSELKLQALRAQMNPHFIFNTLNSIQYYISSNERKPAYEYLSKFSKLMRNILDNSEKSALTIAEELESLQLYLDLESLRFEGKFHYKLDVDPTIDTHNLEIPTLLIQPFVENAIQHGLRFKRTKGALDIKLTLDGESLVCLIQDNGIGITKSQELKHKQNGHDSQNGYNGQNGHHKPAGLKVTQERLQTMNTLRRNGRSVEIIDLSQEDGRSTGTRVKIVIPVE